MSLADRFTEHRIRLHPNRPATPCHRRTSRQPCTICSASIPPLSFTIRSAGRSQFPKVTCSRSSSRLDVLVARARSLKALDHFARIPGGKNIIRHVARYHAASADHRPISYADPRANDRSPAYPDVGADLHRFPELKPLRLISASIGWVAAYICTAGPKSTLLPMVTGITSRTTQLKLKNTLLPSRILLP